MSVGSAVWSMMAMANPASKPGSSCGVMSACSLMTSAGSPASCRRRAMVASVAVASINSAFMR